MNTVITGGVLLLSLLASTLGWAQSSYTLVRGEAWHGAVVENLQLRSLDSICEQRTCYRFDRFDSRIRAQARSMGINDLQFEALAKEPGVVREGNRLILPEALGRPLYQYARWDYMRRQFRERQD